MKSIRPIYFIFFLVQSAQLISQPDSLGKGSCIDADLIDPNYSCTTIYDPVCGCDGRTYANACEAQYRYGVTSWTQGPCPGSTEQEAGFALETNSRTTLAGELVKINYQFPDSIQEPALSLGDGTVLTLEKANGTVPHNYAWPGVYKVDLLAAGETKASLHFLVLSCGWDGYTSAGGQVRDRSRQPCDFIDDGELYIPPDEVAQDVYWSNFGLFRNFNRPAVGTELTVRLKVSRNTGGISCFDPSIRLYGSEGEVLLRMMQPGCAFYSAIVAGSTVRTGSSHDLSALVADFTDWRELGLQINGDSLVVLLDDDRIYRMVYTGSIGEVWGIGISFKGSGVVDWIDWRETGSDEPLFLESFDVCTSTDDFQPAVTVEPGWEYQTITTQGVDQWITQLSGRGEPVLFANRDSIYVHEATNRLEVITSNACLSDTTVWKRSITQEDTLCLRTDSLRISREGLFEIPVLASGNINLTGLQMSFTIPDRRISIDSITSVLPGWSLDNYIISDSSFQLLWVGLEEPFPVPENDTLFKILASWESRDDACIAPFLLDEDTSLHRVLGLVDDDVYDVGVCTDFSVCCFDLVWDLLGTILHREGSPFAEVQVQVDTMQSMTDANGNYTFTGLRQDSVHVKTDYQSDPGIGVDVLDMVVLYRHLLQLNPIAENYAFLAGDVDGDTRLSLADLANIQLMILGKIDQWPREQSWIFTAENNLPGEQLLQTPPQIVAFKSIPDPVGIGIQIGDVVREPERRKRARQGAETIPYQVDLSDHRLHYYLDLEAFHQSRGLQMDIYFPYDRMQWQADAEQLDYANLVAPGILRIVLLNRDQFPSRLELVFSDRYTGMPSPDLQIVPRRHAGKLITETGEIKELVLQRRQGSDQAQVIVFPNPVGDWLYLRFEEANPEPLWLEIYNILGQKLLEVPLASQPAGNLEAIAVPSKWPAGTYHYHLRGKQYVKAGTLLKQ